MRGAGPRARCVLLAVLAVVAPIVAVCAVPGAALAAAPAQVAAGDNHTCVLRSGAVSCWGADEQGQLGDGGSTDRPYLTPVHLSGVRVASLAAGGDRACAAATT